MAGDFTFSLTGIDELVKNLENVSYDMKRKTGRSALRKAAMVVVNAAKQNVAGHDDPATGRKISDNINLRWNGKLFKSTGDIGFRIGVLKGARLPKDNNATTGQGTATPHWRLLELGTKVAIAKPFLRPALEQNVAAVTKVFLDTYAANLTKAIKKASQ